MKFRIVYSSTYTTYYVEEILTNPVQKFFMRETVVSTQWILINSLWYKELCDFQKYKIKLTNNDKKDIFCFETKEDAQFFIDDYLTPLIIMRKLLKNT